jgi:16S rRNA C967 or C1407 C5-methylase (RsmB/RsmF family)
VYEALQDERISSEFELVEALPAWKHRGEMEGNFADIGYKCLRASPEMDLTNGFFVALFQKKSLIRD